MTDQIDFRESRAQRGADIDDPAIESASAVRQRPGDGGETAWRVDEATEKPAAPPSKNEAEPAAIPPFPGLVGGIDEEEPAGPGLDIMRFVRGVWKRRWLVAGIATAITLLSVLLALFMIDHKWEASAVLVLRSHQDEFTLGSATPFKPQEYNLQTLLDTVKLPSTLDAIIKANGLAVLPRTLAAAIGVTQGKESNMFQLKVIWDDPQTAATITNQIAAMLIDRSRAMRRKDAEDAYEYYNAQLEEARASRQKIHQEMKQFQSETQSADFDTEMKVLIEELATLDAEFGTRTAEVAALLSTRERLAELIGEQPEMVVISTIYRSPLKQRLSEYEWELQEALSRYTADNPKVVKLQKRIAVLEKMIAESDDEGAPQNTYAPNNQRTEMQTRLQKMDEEIKVLQAQVGALGQTRKDMRDKLAQLTSNRKAYDLIRSRLEGANSLESSLISRVDEARVIMLRNEARFDLVEAARPPPEPLPSARKLLVAAGVVLGGGAGLFVALLLELLDPLVRSRRDVMDLTGAELVLEFQRVPPGAHSVIDASVPSEPVATLFRRLLNDLSAGLADEDWQYLAISSVEPGAGRTLVSTNLAQALALKEQPVILVDMDLRAAAGRRPCDLFDLGVRQRGLWQAVSEAAPLDELLIETETSGLTLLTAGSPPARHGESVDAGLVALGRRQLLAVVTRLEQSGRHVLFDLPPLAAQETVLEAAAAIGNLLLVVRSGQTARSELREMAETLRQREIEVRAVLLTDVPRELLEAKPVFESGAAAGRFERWRQRLDKTSEVNLGTHV